MRFTVVNVHTSARYHHSTDGIIGWSTTVTELQECDSIEGAVAYVKFCEAEFEAAGYYNDGENQDSYQVRINATGEYATPNLFPYAPPTYWLEDKTSWGTFAF